MGTVTIGEKELRVLEDKDAGSFKRDVELTRVSGELKDLEGVALQMKLADLVFVYVGAPLNEGITLQWLVEHLANVRDTLRACRKASGHEIMESAPGEAPRP